MVMMALEGLERVLQVEEGRELAKRSRGGGGKDDDNTPLVSASLIEKALEKHNSSAVTKRAQRIWKQHFVSCALCKESFSRHRPADAHFCNECKCHVCSNCDCKVYHLSYQEDLWAAEDNKNEASKKAKKNKKAKKKANQKKKEAEKIAQEEEAKKAAEAAAEEKAKKKQQQQKGKKGQRDDSAARSRSSTIASSNDDSSGKGKGDDDDTVPTSAPAVGSGGQDVDFVAFLENSGSIIALAKLMDAFYDDKEDEEDEIDPALAAELEALKI